MKRLLPLIFLVSSATAQYSTTYVPFRAPIAVDTAHSLPTGTWFVINDSAKVLKVFSMVGNSTFDGTLTGPMLYADTIESKTASQNIILRDSFIVRGSLGIGQASTIEGWIRIWNKNNSNTFDIIIPDAAGGRVDSFPDLSGQILLANANQAASDLGAVSMDALTATSYTGGMLTAFDTARVGYLDKANTWAQTQTLSGNLILTGTATLDTVNGTIVFTGPVTVGGLLYLDTLQNPLGAFVLNDSLTVTGRILTPIMTHPTAFDSLTIGDVTTPNEGILRIGDGSGPQTFARFRHA